MANLMKVAKIAREYVKPTSITPLHLRNFKLSLLDQLAPSVYAPMVFFYPMQDTHNLEREQSYRVKHLKQSLSPFLTRFYPFAGRIKDHVTIDCNDAGVEFLEAKVNTRLEDFLKHPNANALKYLLPIDIESRSTKKGLDHLVHIQTNTFACGGLALGICWSHKITDGGTVSAFMRGWSSMALGLGNEVIPEYEASSLFPPTDSSISQQALELDTNRTITRRFVFDGPKIMNLKARIASEIASRANLRSRALSVMSQSMNIRRRTIPPLKDTSIGNLVGYYVAKIEESGDDDIIHLDDLVAKQRQGKTEAINNYAKKLLGKDAYIVIRELFKEARSLLRRDDVEFFKCLSTCGDGLYEADFGWGKPIWLSLVSLGYKNTFALSETKHGGGIEAWVTLEEDDMAIFECDLDLLEFASLNPSVIEMDEESQLLKQVESRLMFGDDPSYNLKLLTW
ncbi:Salutaridinol 7-O-acetyltransferase [Bienertia sinuspersici]